MIKKLLYTLSVLIFFALKVSGQTCVADVPVGVDQILNPGFDLVDPVTGSPFYLFEYDQDEYCIFQSGDTAINGFEQFSATDVRICDPGESFSTPHTDRKSVV